VRTVQDYLDEVPAWLDGTPSKDTPLTRMQRRIFWLACAGKFFEGLIVFMTGVALPLITRKFDLSATDQGLVTAASLAGILVGASALGGLADWVGRKPMFIGEMGIFALFLIMLTLAPNFLLLVVSLFGAGVALGCDYPTAHIVISESIPTRARGRSVLMAFAFQAVGAFAGTAVGFIILVENPNIEAWRCMYATAIVPAILVALGRFFVTESPHWLMSRRRLREAETETLRLLKRRPEYPRLVKLTPPHESARAAAHYGSLFQKRNVRATILASVPWFLQDLGIYGIGIFTPTVLAVMVGTKAPGNSLSATIHNDMLGARGSAMMDMFFFVGIIAAILLVEKFGRIKLQIVGFVGCAIGLFTAGFSIRGDGSNNLILLFVGFVVFYFMTNLGPNAMTYLLAGEVFPTPIRARGAGFAASFAKLGGVLTAFFFPFLLHAIGTAALLYALACASIAGALVTWIFAIETKGLSLESLEARTISEPRGKENGAALSHCDQGVAPPPRPQSFSRRQDDDGRRSDHKQ
jgi:MFS transporter, putative metabolite transport protein